MAIPEPEDTESVVSALVNDIRKVREGDGSKALTSKELPEIDDICRRVGMTPVGRARPTARRKVLQDALARLGDGRARLAAEHLLALHEDSCELPAASRRKEAARLYPGQPIYGKNGEQIGLEEMDSETFRREREPELLRQVAVALLGLEPPPPPPSPELGVPPDAVVTGTPRRWRPVVVVLSAIAVIGLALGILKLLDTGSKGISLSYDFDDEAKGIDGWGEHPTGGQQTPGQGVERACGPSASGACSLGFTPTRATDRDMYVTVRETASRSKIQLRVFVPPGVVTCPQGLCSTATIIVFDHGYGSHESDYVELVPGKWQILTWDVGRESWPTPWQDFGVHFYLRDGVNGPFYVDAVSARPR